MQWFGKRLEDWNEGKVMMRMRRNSMSEGRGRFLCLHKSCLGSVIFGCTNDTIAECLQHQLFGLPSSHLAYVQNVEPGMPLFLFNYTDKKLHGIFEAASHGQNNINIHAWTKVICEKTKYPAQVRVRIKEKCQPLAQEVFKKAIIGNYYENNLFHFELNHAQTRAIISLFHANSGPSIATPSFYWKEVTRPKFLQDDADDDGEKPMKPLPVANNLLASMSAVCGEELMPCNAVAACNFENPSTYGPKATDSLPQNISGGTWSAGSKLVGNPIEEFFSKKPTVFERGLVPSESKVADDSVVECSMNALFSKLKLNNDDDDACTGPKNLLSQQIVSEQVKQIPEDVFHVQGDSDNYVAMTRNLISIPTCEKKKSIKEDALLKEDQEKYWYHLASLGSSTSRNS